MGFGLIIGLVVWVLLPGLGVLGAGAAVLAALAAWWLESQLWPWTNCWYCQGKPRTGSSWFAAAWRECLVCGGRGKRRRILARAER